MGSSAIALFSACFLLLLSCLVSNNPHGFLQLLPQRSSSKKIDENEPSDIRQKVIEDFKSKVLRNLKMQEPPRGNLSNHFSYKLIELLQEEEKEITISEKKENVIVHPSNNNFTCERGNGTFCRQFEFHITSDLESIITVHAYFHTMELNERLTLSVYDPDSPDNDPLIKLREESVRTKSNPEWISFELPKKLALEVDDNHMICSVEIEGSDISLNGEESPFMVVTKHNKVTERKKRDIAFFPSNENCTCCEDIYHVTLEDIGWQDWVIAPQSINIKVCRGECIESLSHFTLTYTHIIRAFFKLNPSFLRPTCLLTPQCKASNSTSLLMFFRKENGEIVESNMGNMIILNCKCMIADL